MRWSGAVLEMALVAALAGCQTSAPPAIVTPPPAAGPSATPAPTRPLGVAVAVGSPTATPELVGDYATLLRPKLQTTQQDFKHLEQQLAVAQKAPMRMAEDDWRNQTKSILEDMFAASADLRTLSSRLGGQAPPLNTQVLKLADDVDFVANEFRMALDYDPDSTHFIRAARAEKTTADELASLLSDLH